MTKDELAMLDFAVTWAPFGGGDEHILTEFGVLLTVFYRRLQRLLTHHTTVNDGVRRQLDEVCTLKLAPTDPEKAPSHSRLCTLHPAT